MIKRKKSTIKISTIGQVKLYVRILVVFLDPGPLDHESCKQLHIRIDQVTPLHGSERSKQLETSAANFVFLA